MIHVIVSGQDKQVAFRGDTNGMLVGDALKAAGVNPPLPSGWSVYANGDQINLSGTGRMHPTVRDGEVITVVGVKAAG